MSTEPAIIVRRQLVDVAVGGTERDGLAVQRHLSEHVSDVVASSLIASFRMLDLGDDHLVVERLAVDVDAAGIAGLDDAITDAVRRGVEELIRRHVPAGPPDPDASVAHGPVVRRSAVGSVVEAFVEFLTTGRLPWGFVPEPGADLESAVRAAWERADRDGGPSGWPSGRRVLADSRCRARLVQQFSDAFVVGVVRRVDRSVGDTLAALLRTSSSSDRTGPRTDSDALASTVGGAFAAIWRRAVLKAAVESAVAGDSLDEVSLARSALADLDPAWSTAPEVLSWFDDRWPDGPRRPADASATDRPVVDDAGHDVGPALAPGPSARAPTEPDGWPVDHAGVVLLHPFLPQFFEGLGLGTPGGLADPGRAVALIHHLATGTREVPEHETTVAKILCGLPFEEPVEREVGFTADELDESEALIAAVIRHWDALGRTGPAALRAEFLSRPGLLSVDASDDWVLRVEQRTVDILLGQLPWGIAMVKTPWMDRLMRVEWGP